MRLFSHRIYLFAVSFVAAVIVAGIVMERVVAFKVSQITHPAKAENYTMADDSGKPIQQVSFKASDGLNLTGWYVPSRNSATIILQHGYHGNSAQMLPVGLMLARHGYGVLFFDFRGHGKSEGSLVTMGLHEIRDTDAAVTFLRQQQEADTPMIGLLGNSMGGATGILAAAENQQIRALAVEGAFAELKDEVGIGIEVQTPLPASPFDSIFILFAQWQTGYRFSDIAPVKRIGDISPRAVFIMQGGNDTKVLRSSGERLIAAAGKPKEYWNEPSAAHGAIFKTAPEEYEKRIISFFDKYLLGIR